MPPGTPPPGGSRSCWPRPPQMLTATVRDDGRGFDVRAALQPARQPFGLLGMRERVAVFGGSVDVTSEPGRGTVVEARIPLAPGGGR